ncbi:MAG: tetratricopeptide repeat protein [Phycisphaerae bacterium]
MSRPGRSKAFVGREDELAAFQKWVAAPASRPAALLVGPAGAGKSSLLRRCATSFGRRNGQGWFIHHARVNANEAAGPFLDRLLRDAYDVLRRRFIPAGPDDHRQKQELLEHIPAVGGLLSTLVSSDRRPAWQRFRDYIHAIGSALRADERFVLLIDPLRTMKDEQAEEWLSVAAELPATVRVLLAQRPDDCVAAHAEAHRHFHRLLQTPLGDLSAETIAEWYDIEISQDRLRDAARRWSHDVRRRLALAAAARYAGHAFAHDAVITLLGDAPSADPVAQLQAWPATVEELLDMLWRSVASLGEDHVRAALVLQLFGVAAPLEPWAQAADLPAERLSAMLAEPRFAHFFDGSPEAGLQPYHALFAARIERELEKMPQRRAELAEKCWAVVEPHLDLQKLNHTTPPPFFLFAAPAVARRFDSTDRWFAAVNVAWSAKFRLGMLDAAVADLGDALGRTADSGVQAAVFGNLGLIYQTRGDLDQAEAMLRKSLAINEKLGRLEGMAAAYGNLGLIYQTRGDLDQAEAMHRKALEINEKLGRLEGMASQYGNLGVIYRTRGDLDQAEEMYKKSLAISEKLGLLKLTANQYGNLGVIYQTRGELDQAESMHRKSLEIEEKLGRLEGMAIQYGNLGLIYRTRGDLDQAEEMYKKSLAISEKLGLLELTANQYGNLGVIYKTRGELDQAEAMLRKALAIDEKLGRLEGMAIAYGNLGVIAKQRGQIAEARRLWTLSRDLYIKIGAKPMVVQLQGWLDGLSPAGK